MIKNLDTSIGAKSTIASVIFIFLVFPLNLSASDSEICKGLSVDMEIMPPDGAVSAQIDYVAEKTEFVHPFTFQTLPITHCEVRGKIDVDPLDPSVIRFLVRLPVNWNRKFMMAPGGGAGGNEDDESATALTDTLCVSETCTRPYQLVPALERGYATATTDYGHRWDDPLWALDIPPSPGINNEREVNFAYRAVHLVAVLAKNIIDCRYDQELEYAYFKGGSMSGYHALQNAVMFPDDFDGIIAGYPDVGYATDNAISAYLRKLALKKDISIAPEKLAFVTDVVLDKCDLLDGFEDRMLDDPTVCSHKYFNPHRDLPKCKKGMESELCFTNKEINHIKKFYKGPPKGLLKKVPSFNDGTVLPQNFVVGSELPEATYGYYQTIIGWSKGLTDVNEPLSDFPDELVMDLALFVFDDPDFLDPANVDNYLIQNSIRRIFRDLRHLEDLNVSADLSAFKANGGKLIFWHGWLDSLNVASATIGYYEKLESIIGDHDTTREFARLFMVPGVGHAFDGIGPQFFDIILALEDWVENDMAPDYIPAFITGAFKQNLCPYPKKVMGPDNLTCIDPIGDDDDDDDD